MTLRALIAGYYGAGNAGDEWILSGLLSGLRRRDSGIEARVLSYDPESTQREHGVEALGWQDIDALADAVRWSSLVIVGGGGLWQDYWGYDPLDFLSGRPGGIAGYGTPILLAHLIGRPCAMLGVGVGPLRSNEARAAVRDLAGMCGIVSVRDTDSRQELVACGVDPGRVQVGADLAFLADPLPSGGGCSAKGPTLGVNLRPWQFAGPPEVWEAEIASALRAWCLAHEGRVVFVPLQESSRSVDDDRAVSARVAAALGLPDRVEVAPAGLAWADRLSHLACADIVVGMRYHALLAAIRSGAPCVALAYDPKVRWLMRESGVERNDLDPESWTQHRVLAALEAAVCPDGVAVAALGARASEGMERALRLDPAPKVPSLLGSAAIGQAAQLRRMEQALGEPLGLPSASGKRAEADLEAVRRLAEERDGLTQGLERARREAEQAWAGQAAAEARARELERGLAGAGRALEEAGNRASEATAQLAALRATAGVRVLALYWRFVRRLAPEGSRAHFIYRHARLLLRQAIKGALAPESTRRVLGPHPSWPAGRLGPGPGDATWWQALDGFLARRAGEGDDVTVFILAPTRFSPDEGQRSYHLTRQLAARGRRVVFGYWRWNLAGAAAPLDAENGILAVPLDVLLSDPDRALQRAGGCGGIVILEFPLPEATRFMAAANALGYLTVYDVVDDWGAFHKQGQADWYRDGFERGLGAVCDVLICVSPELAARTGKRCGRKPRLIPNAWSDDLLSQGAPAPVERGVATLGYFGYLTEAWFDWGLLLACARLRPAWRFHLIGYGGGRRTSRLPANIVYHGKVPRTSLSSHAARWDVGIVPFREGALARSADPIKVYEYIALDLPVVGAGVRPPVGAEGLVEIVSGAEEFALAVEAAIASRVSTAEARAAFARSSTWTARVDELERALADEPRAALKRRIFEAA